MTGTRSRATLTRETRTMWHGGATVAYRVHSPDGQWIGWVGDGRLWIGHRYGGRYWWACHRCDGDTVARWSSGLRYRTRAAALADLLAIVHADPRSAAP